MPELTVLDNGVRVATEHVPQMRGVSLGVRIDCGSRDEPPELAGVSHLLEHMVFKGTATRSARDIAEAMDEVGGQLDAFTSKECTGYGARVLPDDVPLAVEILTDMLRNSRLDPDDVRIEKAVILEEIRAAEDAPDEHVHDLFAAVLWPDHPLGRPVAGTIETVSALEPDQIRRHLETAYTPDRMIWVAAGAVEHDTFVSEVARGFGDLRGSSPPRTGSPPVPASGEIRRTRRLEQTYFCLGVPGVGETDPRRWTARVLALILGGGMSSRLFQEIREKRGLCYSIGADSISFREAGMFVVWADTGPAQAGQVRELIRAELDRMAECGPDEAEVQRARNQVRAATLLLQDELGSRAGRLAHSLQYHNRLVCPEETISLIQAVTRADCRELARALFSGTGWAYAGIGPERPRARGRR